MTLRAIVVIGLFAWLPAGHAASSQLLTPIKGKSLQGVQKVDLNLAAIAAYTNQPRHLYVVDISQQVMPMRIEQPVQKTPVVDYPLQIYRWPGQALFDNARVLSQLQLQLRQGDQQAIVNWSDQQGLRLSQQENDQTWLLATPNLPKNTELQYLLLNWAGQDVSSQVQVEGSDNLVDWHFAGLGQILQTRSEAGQPLLQQRVEIRQSYPFWRIRFDQPIHLQQASLQSRQIVTPLWQQQSLRFKQVASNPQQWQLDLPYAIAIQKMQFNIPAEQLWSVRVEARQVQQGREGWQQVAQTELYHNGSLADNTSTSKNTNQINFNRPVSASQWRLSIEAPIKTAQLDVEVFAPRTTLYFLAQGAAPYRLIVDSQGLRSAPKLPEQLDARAAAYLGETVVHKVAASTRQYGLWAGLLILVGILAFAAWRLFRNLQRTPQN